MPIKFIETGATYGKHIDGGWADAPRPVLSHGARPARDAHGPIKAGVTFERKAAEPVVCRECIAKDAVILALASRLDGLRAHLAMLAERERLRGTPFMPPPEMIEP